jgi:hypothetical protein
MHNLRTFARSFEPHPFQRLPVTAHPAPADWGKLVKRSVKQAAVYVVLLFSFDRSVSVASLASLSLPFPFTFPSGLITNHA